MSKRALFLSIAFFIATAMSAKVYIPLVKSVPPGTNGSGSARVETRTDPNQCPYVPVAYYEIFNLQIDFPGTTIPRIRITDEYGNTITSIDYEEIRSSVQIFMGPLNFGQSYRLYVYAFDTWWEGTFGFKNTVDAGFYCIKVSQNKEQNYGVYSVAGYASSGRNYAVCGVVPDQSTGAGIYGTSNVDKGFNSKDRYAGLFHGDLKTTDAVYATVYNTLADSRLTSDNRHPVDGSLDNLMQLSVFKYGLKQFVVDDSNESLPIGYFNDDSDILGKEHFGLSGQEISKIYPDLVSKSQDGYMSINYIEMIPLLIQSIQELKTELDNTNAELEALKSNLKAEGRASDQTAVLYQCVPSSFTERCVVKCRIPDYINDAQFHLFDFNGRLIQSRTITDRGDVQVVVERGGLEAGLYLYSLITDGKIVDTMKMVLMD